MSTAIELDRIADIELSPITYEVIRNRLIGITEEMRVALQSVSGSPTVTEASDFFTGLFLPDGSFASMGFQVSFQAPVVGTLIKYINARPHMTMHEGDMFIGNDPYIGALHQNDVQMAGPIYADGEIIAWAGVEAHQTDVGGMDFASWSPKARNVYQEGIRIPCVKLVDRGETRHDVLEMILTASRLPDQFGLDIRAFIATINVARDRIDSLVKRYGAKIVVDVMRRMIDASETRIRARLLEMPDGEFRAADFLEHDGHTNVLYKLDLHLTKRGDHLTFDFSGSSPQAPGFINCTRAGLAGAVAGALLPTLAFDIPWNQGVMRAINIVAPDGLVCTAKFPTPVGAATVEAVWVTSNAVLQALNKLLACSEQYRHRAQAVSDGTMTTFNLGGINQYGENFGLHLMDPLAGGLGAFASKDGVDAGGPTNTPAPSIADVERNEQAVPLFYLYRRLATDTGGAGRFRGGLSAELAISIGGVDKADALIMTHGLEVPNAAGIFGAWPGATVRQSLGRNAIANGRARTGKWQAYGPKPGLVPITNRDVFMASWQGGGGWGDPLDREIGAVARDVETGAVSRNAAKKIFGVVFTARGVDAASTKRQRQAMRKARVGRFRKDARSMLRAEPRLALGDALFLVRDRRGWHVVSKAGYILATNSTRWRKGAIAVTWKNAPPEYKIKLHKNLAMTAYYCPASGTLLSVDIHEKGSVPPDDVVIDLTSIERRRGVAASGPRTKQALPSPERNPGFAQAER